MVFSLLNPQPGPRAPSLAYDDRGPGLYPGEAVVAVGEMLIAVSVEPHWLANGSGIAFKGCARWVGPDGATHLCAHGQHIEIEYSASFDAGWVQAHGAAALSREVLLLLLGEPPTLVDVPGGEPAPMLNVAEEVRLNTSIIRAIATIEAAHAATDVTALLSTPSGAE